MSDETLDEIARGIEVTSYLGKLSAKDLLAECRRARSVEDALVKTRHDIAMDGAQFAHIGRVITAAVAALVTECRRARNVEAGFRAALERAERGAPWLIE